MRTVYPEITPYHTDKIKVSEIHTVYFEECGNPNGRPVVFLHGGPGGGIQPSYRQYFNPEKWRIILLDQRGCGQSAPFAELRENTTWDLVADIETLRQHLKIEKWAVFGGSWGSTLALTYGITHPESCTAFFLRGIFLLRKKEIDWFYQEGCSKIYPDAWESYLKPIPHSERGDLVQAYHQRLTSPDAQVRRSAAKAWAIWEGSTSKLIPDNQMIEHYGEDNFAEAFARIECHYFTNKGFFPEDNFLLNNVHKIRYIPAVIVQGRYDVVCPAENAWDLHRAWPEAELKIIPNAGHSLSEIGTTDALIEATDRF
ncbi:MAG: prolyl aminopeptidase [Candidatus Saccharibacteria bacterium]|nr:prolyl aminopeptidase [Moraxellaceae bacterium]